MKSNKSLKRYTPFFIAMLGFSVVYGTQEPVAAVDDIENINPNVVVAEEKSAQITPTAAAPIKELIRLLKERAQAFPKSTAPHVLNFVQKNKAKFVGLGTIRVDDEMVNDDEIMMILVVELYKSGGQEGIDGLQAIQAHTQNGIFQQLLIALVADLIEQQQGNK